MNLAIKISWTGLDISSKLVGVLKTQASFLAKRKIAETS